MLESFAHQLCKLKIVASLGWQRSLVSLTFPSQPQAPFGLPHNSSMTPLDNTLLSALAPKGRYINERQLAVDMFLVGHTHSSLEILWSRLRCRFFGDGGQREVQTLWMVLFLSVSASTSTFLFVCMFALGSHNLQGGVLSQLTAYFAQAELSTWCPGERLCGKFHILTQPLLIHQKLVTHLRFWQIYSKPKFETQILHLQLSLSVLVSKGSRHQGPGSILMVDSDSSLLRTCFWILKSASDNHDLHSFTFWFFDVPIAGRHCC